MILWGIYHVMRIEAFFHGISWEFNGDILSGWWFGTCFSIQL